MLGRLALVVMLAACGGAQAVVVSERPDKVAVMIYHDGTVDTTELSQSRSRDNGSGLALITETRGIDLPAGQTEIQFRGVAGTMVPQTADVSGLPEGAVERNFDYDLLSPGALLAKSVGQTVHLVRTQPRTGKVVERDARVVSGPDGAVLEIDGRFEALGCSGLPERLVFDRVPDGLIDTPTLAVKANAARAGHYTVTLRYIATGLNWSADYVARIGADDRTLDLSGWITLANFADTGFASAPVEVIAGHVETSGEDRPPEAQAVTRNDACWPTNIDWATRHVLNGAPILGFAAPRAMLAPSPAPMIEMVSVSAARKEIEARNLGDYKLYPLPEPTDVAARQTKQVQFLDRSAVPFERVYGYRVRVLPRLTQPEQILPSSILLRLQNTARGGLGKPLPAGGISAMAIAPDGGALLAGHDTIEDTAAGSALEIAMGQTTDVRAQARMVEMSTSERGGIKRRSGTMEVTLVNDKPRPVTFEWRQAMDVAGATLVSETRRHGTRNGDVLWSLTLDPGEPVILRYTIDTPA